MKGKTIMTVSVKFNFGLQGVSQSLAPFLQTTEPSYFCYDIYLQRSSYSSVFLSSCGKNIIYAEYLAFAFHHSEFFSMRWLISPVSPRNDTLKLSGQLFIYCRSSHSWLMFSKLHCSPKNERRYDWLQINLKITGSQWSPQLLVEMIKRIIDVESNFVSFSNGRFSRNMLCIISHLCSLQTVKGFLDKFAANGCVDFYSVSACSVGCF